MGPTEYHNTGFQEARRERIRWLGNYLVQLLGEGEEGVEFSKVRGTLIFKWGFTTAKTDEYIGVVIELYGLELREGRIYRSKGRQIEVPA